MATINYPVQEVWMELSDDRLALQVKLKSDNSLIGKHPIPQDPNGTRSLFIWVDASRPGDGMYYIVEDHQDFPDVPPAGNLSPDPVLKRCFRIQDGSAIGIGDIRDCGRTPGAGSDHLQAYLWKACPSNGSKGIALVWEEEDGQQELYWLFSCEGKTVEEFNPAGDNALEKKCTTQLPDWC